MTPSIIERLARLEARRQIQVRDDVPARDLSGLSADQRAFLREAADMVMKIRRGELEWTDDRVAFVQDAMELLDSCPLKT
jgi:hypothetical protein